MGFLARQGDVLIQSVDAVPPGEPAEKAPGGAIVLAYGESSGHRHQLLARGNKLFHRAGGAKYLEIGARGGAVLEVTTDKGAPLNPVRHEPVKLPPGTYRVTTQREWSLEQEIRNVAD